MRIGELARTTNVPVRMLRYYEEQGLITPRRLDNGYREYDSSLVARVRTIRGLLDSGIPTRIIAEMLPCLSDPRQTLVADSNPKLRALLVEQCDKMTERMTFLEQNRDALAQYIDEMDKAGGSRPEPRST